MTEKCGNRIQPAGKTGAGLSPPTEEEREQMRQQLWELARSNLTLIRELAGQYGLRPPASLEGAPQIRSPVEAVNLVQDEMALLDQEQLRVIVLNAKNRVLTVDVVYQGSANVIWARMAEIFKAAIRLNGVAIICAHNHPSQDPTPSPEDLELTRRLVEASRLLDIQVLDHLVIGGSQYVSLKERYADLWSAPSECRSLNQRDEVVWDEEYWELLNDTFVQVQFAIQDLLEAGTAEAAQEALEAAWTLCEVLENYPVQATTGEE